MTSGTDIPLESPGSDSTRELRRPRDGRMLAGVSAGLAEYFGLRPAVYRIAFAALALVGGAGILLYVVAALVIPAEGADESIAEDFLRRHRDRPVLLIGLAIAAVCAISIASSPGRDWGWPLLGPAWIVLLVVAGLALWTVSRRDEVTDTAAERRRRPRSLFLPGLGVLLAAGGLLVLLDVVDAVDVPLDVVLAGGLVAAGALIATGAFFHRAAGLVPLGLVLLAGVAAAAPATVGEGPIGDRTFHPRTVESLRSEYDIRIGQLELDLSDLRDLPPGDTHVEADAGIGNVVVVVPEDVAVDVLADADYGEVEVFDVTEDGRDASLRSTESGSAGAEGRLVVDAHVWAGRVEVLREAD
jgi:phage shock protein PspC (stress-responsive transcriptional regulator)